VTVPIFHLGAILASLTWFSVLTSARNSFTDYDGDGGKYTNRCCDAGHHKCRGLYQTPIAA
jgi:hypothetical protein